MAITSTPSQIRPLKGASVRRKIVAAAIIAGAAVIIQNDARINAADKASAEGAHARALVLADGYGSTAFNVGQNVDTVVFGPVGGYAGLTPGKAIYIGDAGALTHDKPVAGFVSVIGYAEDANTIFVQPSTTPPVAA